MLALTRKLNQSIMIDDVEVFVVEIRGDGQVRLGVKALRDVAVDRTGIWEQKQQGGGSRLLENAAASRTP